MTGERPPTQENHDADRPSILDLDALQIAGQMLDGAFDPPKRPEDLRGYKFVSDQPIGEGNMGDVWLA